MGQYNPKEDSTFLQYLDANNPYGWAMSQPLPTGGFKWVMPDRLVKSDTKGYLLEADVKYPKNYTTCTMTFHSCVRR